MEWSNNKSEPTFIISVKEKMIWLSVIPHIIIIVTFSEEFSCIESRRTRVTMKVYH
jgi:hypothetical protein